MFQVCTLIDQKSEFTCRQKVGRGLRLCVDQNSERIEDKNINILHVMANESFSEFADTLQKEIEDETGVKFGVLQLNLFAGMVYEDKREVERTVTEEQAKRLIDAAAVIAPIIENKPTAANLCKVIEENREQFSEEFKPMLPNVKAALEQSGSEETVTSEKLTAVSYTETVTEEKEVTYEEAEELMAHFEKKGYITGSGKLKDTMKNALKTGTLDLPKKYEAARSRFEAIIKNSDLKPLVRDASKDVVVRINKQVMVSEEFTELWNKIKQKTAYRVSIDTKKLIENSVKELRDMPVIPKTRLVLQTADIHIENAGISHTEREMRTTDIENSYRELPDIITAISDAALLTPSTVNEILVQSGWLGDFLNNPEAFLEKAAEIINKNRHSLAIDGIGYIKLDGEEYYVQEIFDTEELIANLDRNAVKVEHSVYDYVVYDSSTVERPFAVALDNNPDVKMFFKIPDRFKIDTPIGTYNPDWAVYMTKNGEEKLYFILETKGSTDFYDLRTKEQLKIHCGKQHFKALDNGIEMRVARDWTEFNTNL